MGTTLLACSPIVSYAQYYYGYNSNYYGYNYTPLYITTTNATNITSAGVTLNGLVNGNNLYSTYNVETWFEYGVNTNFGYSTAHINSNSGYAVFSSNVANLSSNTIYYFRAVGQSPQGIVYGSTNSFRTNFGNVVNTNNTETVNVTNPSIVTNPATSVGSTSAKLNSLITNSVDNPGTTWFEWGTVPTLGNTTTIIPLGTLASAKHINTITGLDPGTTYYFRAVLQNSSSKINGVTLSFTTNRAATIQSNTIEKTDDTNMGKEKVTNTSVIEPVGSALGASVIGSSGSFLPINIIGWLILIDLILFLILLTKHLHRNLSGKKTLPATEHGHA